MGAHKRRGFQLTFMGSCITNVFSSITDKTQRYTIIYFCEMLYMFQAVPPPIIMSSRTIYKYTAMGTLSNLFCYQWQVAEKV